MVRLPLELLMAAWITHLIPVTFYFYVHLCICGLTSLSNFIVESKVSILEVGTDTILMSCRDGARHTIGQVLYLLTEAEEF